MDAIYDELFALRIQYMDTMSEYEIIRRLKQKLFDEYDIPYELVNEQLHLFYITYDIAITFSEIEEVDIDEEENSVDLNIIEEPGSLGDFISQLSNLLSNIQLLEEQQQMDDVVVTTDIDSIGKLPILKCKDDIDINCSICMDNMKKDDEYIDIKCKHIFHKDCLTNYLQNFNHICPICRDEIGETKVNI